MHAVLRRAFKQAQRWGWITSNPAGLASPPRVLRSEIHPPGREVVAAFAAKLAVSDPDLGTLVWVAAVAGARRGELCGLQRGDLDTATLEVLQRHRPRLCERAVVARIAMSDELPIFPNDLFQHLHPDTVSKRHRVVADQSGMPGRLHDLRHSAATQALAAGIPVRTIAGRLGHADPSMTHNVYAHFVEVSDQHAADVLGALLDEST